MADEDEDMVLEHPNREKAASKLTRLIVVVLLIASAAVVLIVTLGGWGALEAQLTGLVFVVVDFVLALFVARWSRGVLPMAAGIAVILGIFAAVAAPAWFSRDNPGFTNPALPSSLLGLLCIVLIIVQLALIVFAMQGFRQQWNVEVERPRRQAEPAPA